MIDQWQTSEKGNPYALVADHHVVVYPIGDRFTFRITEPDQSVYMSQSRYTTEQQAIDGATEAVRKLIEWA